MKISRIAGIAATACLAVSTPSLRAQNAPAAERPASAKASKPMVEADMNVAPVPYDATGSYKPGQRVDHPAFGPGVVERVLATNKVQIFFATGSRVLAQRRD